MEKKKIFAVSMAIILLICAISLGLFFGCHINNKEAEPRITDKKEDKVLVEKSRIKDHIQKLTGEDFQGRRAGTSGEAEAALFLAKELKNMGLKPLGTRDTFFQTFSLPKTGLRWEGQRLVFYLKDSYSPLLSDNILGLIESSSRPQEYILLSAHFDHLGLWEKQLFPGANDNGSGVSAVLEIARALKHNRELPYSVIVAFFGAEEMGLIGSNFFADNPTIDVTKVRLAINIDSIGSGAQNDFIQWSDGPQAITDNLFSQWSLWRDIELIRQTSAVNTSDHKALGRLGIPSVTILSADWLKGNHTREDKSKLLNYDKITFLAQNITDFLSTQKIEGLLQQQ
ncbi:MAG: hypothetical protein JM58_06210 [Peptococcaceae bacterium BICA1-8]|nr:MAG: hypothetical protein JM58_06210 [Peptococcaceae bacterium BICA1-8]